MAIKSEEVNIYYPFSRGKEFIVSHALKCAHDEKGISFLSKEIEVLFSAYYMIDYLSDPLNEGQSLFEQK